MKSTILIIVGLAVVLAAVGVLVLQDRWIGANTAPSAVLNEPPTDETIAMTGGEMDLVLFSQTADETLPIADGLIADMEYGNHLLDSETGMTLYWQNDETNLYVGLISPGTGWAGVGFSQQTGKPGSNIIIGVVDDGQVTIRDAYGVTKRLHRTDQVSSLLSTGGSEADGQTVLEFSIPLANADSEDVPLAPGQVVQVILAYQATKDSLTTMHTRYAMTQIQLD